MMSNRVGNQYETAYGVIITVIKTPVSGSADEHNNKWLVRTAQLFRSWARGPYKRPYDDDNNYYDSNNNTILTTDTLIHHVIILLRLEVIDKN